MLCRDKANVVIAGLTIVALASCERQKAKPRDASLAIQSLAYLNWVPTKKKSQDKAGVTRHDRKRAFQGLNLYTSRHETTARLIDMEGRTVHTWSSTEEQPTAADAKVVKTLKGWQHVELGEDRELFAFIENHALLKLDARSKVIWSAKVAAHHDLDIAPNGDIYVLAVQRRAMKPLAAAAIKALNSIPGARLTSAAQIPVADEHLVVLSPKGVEKRRISFFELLMADPVLKKHLKRHLESLYAYYQAERVRKRLTTALVFPRKEVLAEKFEVTNRLMLGLLRRPQHKHKHDILHANTVEILPRREGLWNKGDVLVSFRNIDLIAVVDLARKRVVWHWGPGEIEGQHQPTLLDSGNILLFDNGMNSKRSRLLEVDPTTKKIVWTYMSTPPSAFHSRIRGGCQRLPNGNTLITNSNSAQIFEVTRRGEVVWEFFNPVKDKGQRAVIYRMQRIASPSQSG